MLSSSFWSDSDLLASQLQPLSTMERSISTSSFASDTSNESSAGSSDSDAISPRPAAKGVRNRGPARFLIQLVSMLVAESRDIIYWSSGYIVLEDVKRLLTLLPTYFQHCQYASLQRQLHYFGFAKIEGKGRYARSVYVNKHLIGKGLESIFQLQRKTGRNVEDTDSVVGSRTSTRTRNSATAGTRQSQRVSTINNRTAVAQAVPASPSKSEEKVARESPRAVPSKTSTTIATVKPERTSAPSNRGPAEHQQQRPQTSSSFNVRRALPASLNLNTNLSQRAATPVITMSDFGDQPEVSTFASADAIWGHGGNNAFRYTRTNAAPTCASGAIPMCMAANSHTQTLPPSVVDTLSSVMYGELNASFANNNNVRKAPMTPISQLLQFDWEGPAAAMFFSKQTSTALHPSIVAAACADQQYNNFSNGREYMHMDNNMGMRQQSNFMPTDDGLFSIIDFLNGGGEVF